MGPEGKLERRCYAIAKSRGCHLFKVVFSGRRGAPDRVLGVPAHLTDSGDGALVFIEFKRPDGPGLPTAHQAAVHDTLRSFGARVVTLNSVERFEEVLDDAFRS